jgi:polyphosphate glucokinase
VGGSGIKGAPVDVKKGVLAGERYRIPTPQPSTPEAIADAAANIARHFGWKGPLGCTVPGVVRKGVVYTAANIDRSWIGADGRRLLQKKTGCRTVLLNDADAAGMAEMKFGAGKGRKGVVILLTFGTGIGSAVFVDGVLVPNTEFGHVPMLTVSRGGI